MQQIYNKNLNNESSRVNMPTMSITMDVLDFFLGYDDSVKWVYLAHLK